MSEPLAYRMRPQTLDEFVGQRHLLAQGAILKQAVSGKPTSLILLRSNISVI
jgi:putative ATPase